MSLDQEKELEKDIRRSIILAEYIKYWGMPDYRTLSKKGNDRIEVYSFPPSSRSSVHRFATICISQINRVGGGRANYEFLLILPDALGGASSREVVDFVLDVATNSLQWKAPPQDGATIGKAGTLMPKPWKTCSLLIQEPLGEAEELSCFHVGAQHIDLLWLVPIHKLEYRFIVNNGIRAFDELVQSSSESLIDVNRSSIVGVPSENSIQASEDE